MTEEHEKLITIATQTSAQMKLAINEAAWKRRQRIAHLMRSIIEDWLDANEPDWREWREQVG